MPVRSRAWDRAVRRRAWFGRGPGTKRENMLIMFIAGFIGRLRFPVQGVRGYAVNPLTRAMLWKPSERRVSPKSDWWSGILGRGERMAE
jgi:hypothetical protein